MYLMIFLNIQIILGFRLTVKLQNSIIHENNFGKKSTKNKTLYILISNTNQILYSFNSCYFGFKLWKLRHQTIITISMYRLCKFTMKWPDGALSATVIRQFYSTARKENILCWLVTSPFTENAESSKISHHTNTTLIKMCNETNKITLYSRQAFVESSFAPLLLVRM